MTTRLQHLITPFMLLFLLVLAFSCRKKIVTQQNVNVDTPLAIKTWRFAHVVEQNIKIKDYFKYMDSLAHTFDTLVGYKLTPHIIVRANPWLIDTLESTDYYRQKEKGIFVYDQQQLIVLKLGDTLFIPTDSIAHLIIAKQAETVLDVNIPEFKLRIIEGNDTVRTFPVRVGQNRIRKWADYDKKAKLRTKTGNGKIINTYFKSTYVDPVSGETHDKTKRDDGDTTLLPLMPWLEPEINGESFGQLIHPTSNENTLGKAYSNGCIGTGEGSMWRIYYYAPLGTTVRVSYNLNVKDAVGEPVVLKDVYGKKAKNN